jgi:hypothetical protein
MTTYLTHYRVGDIVDIKANASEQKGMPHKCEYLFLYSPTTQQTLTNSLPRKDRYRLQRLSPRCWNHLLQGRQRSIHGEASQRPS